MIAIIVLIKLIVINDKTISSGLRGLTNNCPKFLDHISSKKDKEKPNWLLNKTSHNKTPAIKTPPISTAVSLEFVKCFEINPHNIIWNVGQYISSKILGKEVLIK